MCLHYGAEAGVRAPEVLPSPRGLAMSTILSCPPGVLWRTLNEGEYVQQQIRRQAGLPRIFSRALPAGHAATPIVAVVEHGRAKEVNFGTVSSSTSPFAALYFAARSQRRPIPLVVLARSSITGVLVDLYTKERCSAADLSERATHVAMRAQDQAFHILAITPALVVVAGTTAATPFDDIPQNMTNQASHTT